MQIWASNLRDAPVQEENFSLERHQLISKSCLYNHQSQTINGLYNLTRAQFLEQASCLYCSEKSLQAQTSIQTHSQNSSLAFKSASRTLSYICPVLVKVEIQARISLSLSEYPHSKNIQLETTLLVWCICWAPFRNSPKLLGLILGTTPIGCYNYSNILSQLKSVI